MVRRLFERFRGVFHLDDAPWRIALALAVGVFISCTPTFGLQTLLALLVATSFRLNKAAMVTGVWVNLPWLTPLVYAGALKLGAAILPGRTGFGGLWLALLVGTTIVGAAAAVVTYLVAFGALSWRRARPSNHPATGVATPASPEPPVSQEPAA